MSLDSLITLAIAAAVILSALIPYISHVRKSEATARKKFEEAKIAGLQAAVSAHPHINAIACIGCGGCVDACPEGDVLGIIDGKAVLVHGARCVGHGVCAEVCPVGAITMMMAAPGRSAELPILNEQFETNVPNMFIVGELGGLGLIKNAITQGKKVVETIRTRPRSSNGAYDVAVVGAGPGGLAAGLSAKSHKLKYVILEQGDAGGTILQYPRRKIVMTSPVDLPLWGKLKLTETSKETLLGLWEQILAKTQLKVNTNEKVLDIRSAPGYFVLTTSAGEYKARHVILALGRRGTPRKLGVPGEGLGKVTYRLIDAETYKNNDVLVVGGGDSAVEAAIGLALHGTNRVTLSYRKEVFARLKERNSRRLEEFKKKNAVNVVLNSNVREIREKEVDIETSEGLKVLPNDYVFIFAGGEMPFEFLKKTGIRFQEQVVA
ncbi:MAG TPA: NAD(P)-binding domain-containing protein [Bacteroidota bacterium]|nr:NAD(P)-binding domain-containing protein [Bacteroidota bacterium]